MRRRRAQHQDGFTLVEVMVALVIFGIAAAATTPLLVKAIDATQVGKLNTQAKNLLQARVESMRNLPFHVATSAGPYIDLLDTYFRDATGVGANTACATSSWTSATSTYTCGRTALALPGFTESVSSQFVDQNNAVVTPPAGYDSQSATADVPPSQTLAITVTETWVRNGVTKTFSAGTKISSSTTSLPQIVSEVAGSALSVGTAVDDAADPTTLQFDAGLLAANAGLSTGATARAQVQGALTTLSTGQSSVGQAVGYLDAPPDQTSFATVTGTATTDYPCITNLACFGPSTVSGVTGTAGNGLPQVGSAGAPLTATISKSGAAGARGLWISNVPTTVNQLGLVRLGVQSILTPVSASNPTQLLRSVQGSGNNGYSASCTGPGTAVSNTDFVTSTGYIATTGSATHGVTSCTTATARRIDLFPLAGASGFNADGVVQIVLQYAGLQCGAVAGATGTVTANYRATVSWLRYGDTTPTTVTVDSSSGGASPLSSSLLARNDSGIQVAVAPDLSKLYLGDYIQSWSAGALSKTTTTQNAQASLKTLSFTTVPTRDTDTLGTSSLNVVLGKLSCTAQDNR